MATMEWHHLRLTRRWLQTVMLYRRLAAFPSSACHPVHISQRHHFLRRQSRCQLSLLRCRSASAQLRMPQPTLEFPDQLMLDLPHLCRSEKCHLVVSPLPSYLLCVAFQASIDVLGVELAVPPVASLICEILDWPWLGASYCCGRHAA